MSEPLFQIQHLTKSYGGRRVLDDLTFDIHAGECLVILGRSGSGKSVTLRQLNGLERPDSGRVIFDGLDLSELTERQLYPVRRRVSMLFQGGALFDSLNVYENIAFPLREHTDLDEEAIAATVRRKLDLVRLADIEDRMPSALSGGMRKRVALARSLALDPKVVLFDEPTTGLDPMTAATIGHLIRNIQRELGVTAVVVTHDLPLTDRVADRIAFLDAGSFRFTGTLDQARASEDRLLRAFLEGREEEREDVA
ncbi:MAG: ABC transporter ATP-binding protein [Acidobacteriota bacterium]|nr:ABC transporter ATP-binding protein [Acidobacteriota bacterium]